MIYEIDLYFVLNALISIYAGAQRYTKLINNLTVMYSIRKWIFYFHIGAQSIDSIIDLSELSVFLWMMYLMATVQ